MKTFLMRTELIVPKKNWLLIIIFLALLSGHIQAQNDERPCSFDCKLKQKINTVKPPFSTPPKKIEPLPQPAQSPTGERLEKPLPQYAKTVAVNWDIKKMGTVDKVKGGKIWRLRVSSPKAKKISLAFKSIKIPKGAYLFVYNEAKTDIWGPITKGVKYEHEGKIAKTKGDRVIVEYFEPNKIEGAVRIVITRVSHHYVNWGMYRDISCPSNACSVSTKCSCETCNFLPPNKNSSTGELKLNPTSKIVQAPINFPKKSQITIIAAVGANCLNR